MENSFCVSNIGSVCSPWDQVPIRTFAGSENGWMKPYLGVVTFSILSNFFHFLGCSKLYLKVFLLFNSFKTK